MSGNGKYGKGKSNFDNIAPAEIHHYGDPNKCTFEGRTFYRQEFIAPESFGYAIRCTPYSMHFILYDREKLGAALLCSCGSPAVVATPNMYKDDMSDRDAEMLVCYHHARYGVHADGSHEE